jgi:copper oxidase (laccase) domain-containing protein
VVATDALEGDRRPPAALSEALARAVGDRAWSWLRQQHSSDVRVVTVAGEHAGETGDGLVTATGGAFLTMFGADCALVALGSSEGVAGVAHAGWRGALAGVVEATVSEMRRAGATEVLAWRGACIHPCCYEFGEDDLDLATAALGDPVAATTSGGAAAFDLPAAVRIVLERAGARLVGEEPTCTACGEGWYSWRARRDSGRTLVGVWREG